MMAQIGPLCPPPVIVKHHTFDIDIDHSLKKQLLAGHTLRREGNKNCGEEGKEREKIAVKETGTRKNR